MSKSGNFYGDDDRQTDKPIALPLVHARGVIKFECTARAQHDLKLSVLVPLSLDKL